MASADRSGTGTACGVFCKGSFTRNHHEQEKYPSSSFITRVDSLFYWNLVFLYSHTGSCIGEHPAQPDKGLRFVHQKILQPKSRWSDFAATYRGKSPSSTHWIHVRPHYWDSIRDYDGLEQIYRPFCEASVRFAETHPRRRLDSSHDCYLWPRDHV